MDPLAAAVALGLVPGLARVGERPVEQPPVLRRQRVGGVGLLAVGERRVGVAGSGGCRRGGAGRDGGRGGGARARSSAPLERSSGRSREGSGRAASSSERNASSLPLCGVAVTRIRCRSASCGELGRAARGGAGGRGRRRRRSRAPRRRSPAPGRCARSRRDGARP